jgi:transketolase
MTLKMRYLDLKTKIRAVRMLAIEGIAEAGSGHPGASFSAAEIMGALYFRKLVHDQKDPFWKGRDYFINSKGHSAPGFYATLAVSGYFPAEEIKSLRGFGSRLQGHPVRYSEEQSKWSVPGIEYSGGSEGIGLSVSVGLALANRLDGNANHIFTLIGDGESNEGQVWEAAMSASKFGLDNMTAILDRNRIQQDGFTEDIMPLDPVRDKWVAFNWNVIEIDGHRVEQVIDAVNKSLAVKDKPTIIIANTIKGYGIKHMTNNPQWHGKAPGRKQTPILLEELDCEFLIAPSIIAGGKENYEEKIRMAERGGADMIHLDVMDGRFVPNHTFLADTIHRLRKITSMPFDTHLMIENPAAVVDEYISARCDIITVHAEACSQSEFAGINRKLISNGISPGIAINPDTALPDWIWDYLNSIDVVNILSVNPGFPGQKFIPKVLPKMISAVEELRGNGYKGYIEADGGIDSITLPQVYEAGARILVTGNAVYGTPDIQGAILQLKHTANVVLEKKLLDLSTSIGIRNDWLKTRKHILIPFANELDIEEEIHALK